MSAADAATNIQPLEASAQVSTPAFSTPDTADDITKAPFFSDPLFQKLYRQSQDDAAVVSDFRAILMNGRYRVADRDTFLKLLEDAFVLYDILGGKRPMTELLASYERHASPEVFASILVSLHKFIELRLPELVRALPPTTEVLQ